MSRRRFRPAVGVLAMILASACATGGDGARVALDGPETGTTVDGSSGDSASRFDSSSGHDSSSGVDATTGDDAGIDGTTGSDGGGVDATTPDSSAIDSGGVDSGGVDSGGPCSQTCTMGCCDTNGGCHVAPFTNQYCPTAITPGTMCEDCASQGYTCFLDLVFYVCL